MLLEIGIGDSYGRPFEFNTPEFIEANNDVLTYKHRVGEVKDGIGVYTDDTQMSIGVAEQLLSDLPGTQVRYADHFITAYKRDPRKGYSKRITKALEESNPRMPFEFILKANQAGMSSNGSVMRSVPLGLLPDPKEVMHRSIVQTSTSHGHIEAVNSAVAVALTAHFFYYVYPRVLELKKSSKENFDIYVDWMGRNMGSVVFKDILDSYILDSYIPFCLPLQCDSKTTASVSIKLAWGFYISGNKISILHNDAETILRNAIAIGGDVDSSASIALGLYSLRPDVNMNLKQDLYENLENYYLPTGNFGRDYLIALDAKLMAKFPRVQAEELSDFIS